MIFLPYLLEEYPLIWGNSEIYTEFFKYYCKTNRKILVNFYLFQENGHRIHVIAAKFIWINALTKIFIK